MVIPLAAFALAAMASQVLARAPRMLRGMLDRPNARSLHQGLIPRTGGLALLTGLTGAGLTVALLFSLGLPPQVWLMGGRDPSLEAGVWIGLALVPVALVAALDDRGEVRPRYRLAAQILGAGGLLAGGLAWSGLELPGLRLAWGDVLSVPLTLLLVVWMVNLYNFMDGMDGLAGGMAVFGFGTLALLGWRGADLVFALTNASIVAAAAGFLTANFPPARLFLGDLGSTSLGFLAAALSLLGAQRGLYPLWVAGLAFSPFILDATTTLVRRAWRGERLWQAHRSHHYQRLVLAGWSHRQVMVRAWMLMAACGASALAAPSLSVPHQRWLLLAWAGIYALIGYRVGLAERLARPVTP